MASAKQIVRKLNDAYIGLHGRYAAAAAELDNLTAQENEIRRSVDYTPAAKQTRIEAIREKINSVHSVLNTIQAEAEKTFSDIRADARSSFTSYRINPDAIDRNVLDLIDSGIMSAAEIAELVNEKDYAANNHTMARLIGSKMQKMAVSMQDFFHDEAERQRFDAIGYQLSSVKSPIEAMIDAYVTNASAALRPDIDAGMNIHNTLMDTALSEAEAAAESIDG